MTKRMLEAALEGEMDGHLGYAKHDVAGRNGGNSRNGTRSKTVITEVGPVVVEVPRGREGTSEPTIVRKRQRRLEGVDDMVLSLTAKGLTTGEVSAHLAEVYGASVSKDTISAITDRVLGELAECQSRPLDAVPALFIDCIHCEDPRWSGRQPAHLRGAVRRCRREQGHLGLWVDQGGEGAKYWLGVLNELKNRGVADVYIVVCDGLKGLPNAIGAVWPEAIVQTCVLHLIRNTFRLAGRQDWDLIATALRPLYQAPSEQAARSEFDVFAESWGKKYPAIVRLWESAWAEFVPFLAYDVDVRKGIFSTNAVESLNARFRRAVRARGQFPSEPPP